MSAQIHLPASVRGRSERLNALDRRQHVGNGRNLAGAAQTENVIAAAQTDVGRVVVAEDAHCWCADCRGKVRESRI